MRFFQRIIVESLNNVDDGAEPILEKYSMPFSFEDKMENSEFEIVEIIDNEEYQYGLSTIQSRLLWNGYIEKT